MPLFSRATSAAIATIMLAGSAFAQTAAPAVAPNSKLPTTKAPVVHTEASLECSKEADAKGLHGKDRKKFRSECKRTNAKAK